MVDNLSTGKIGQWVYYRAMLPDQLSGKYSVPLSLKSYIKEGSHPISLQQFPNNYLLLLDLHMLMTVTSLKLMINLWKF